MTLLRLWFGGSAALLAAFLIYEYAPILLPMLVVTAGLGVITVVVVAMARRLAGRRDRGRTIDEEPL